MITILLTVSRAEYLERVITGLELLDCDYTDIDFLCIVDGNDELFIKARNLVNNTKYRERLTVKLDYPNDPIRYGHIQRRPRIAAAHNLAKTLLGKHTQYVFSVEDDTLFGTQALNELLKVANSSSAFASAEGVEIGRWGIPYVGGWIADDVYEPSKITSIENLYPVVPGTKPTPIDAGGLYCALIKAELYKQHIFTSDNGLGPDINFGIENRQLGYDNFIVWNVPCTHLFNEMGKEKSIDPSSPTRTAIFVKANNKKWRVTY